MLHDFQREFASGLLRGKVRGSVADDLQVDPRRFGVYAHHTRVSLCIAIENAYPTTSRLVGADFFAEMVRRFVISHPPTHGWLSAYGREFPEFVAQYPPAADLPYLPDLACIEWARVRAANAPYEPGLDLNFLMTFNPGDLENLRLKLHGAASLVCSRFPVFDIWQAHQHGTDDQIPPIELAKGSQDVLITRAGVMEVVVALLGPGDSAFLAALMQQLPFGAACQAAVSAEEEYDLGSRLGDLVSRKVLASSREHAACQPMGLHAAIHD